MFHTGGELTHKLTMWAVMVHTGGELTLKLTM